MPVQPNNQAVHCPDCGAKPGHRCKSPSGVSQIEHASRVHLVYALLHPEADFKRADAERYRLRYPGVQVGRIICAPSRAQALWYGLPYNQAAYEAEHGPDTSVEGSDENTCNHPLCRTAGTPVATCGCSCAGANHGRDGNAVEVEATEYVGESVSELLAKMDIKVTTKAPEDTVSKLTKKHVERNRRDKA